MSCAVYLLQKSIGFMGVEIRKVPKSWQHPKDEKGYYKPLFNGSFEDAFKKWDERRKLWIEGKDPDADEFNYPKTSEGFIEYDGDAPDPEFYRVEKWTEDEARCYQLYENISEGTPVSPVFETLKELEDWLVKNEGISKQEAENLCKSLIKKAFP
jgi:hypothetical protein